MGFFGAPQLAPDRPVSDDQQSIAHGNGLFNIRCHEEDCRTVTGDVAQKAMDLKSRPDVDPARGLIQNDHLWLIHETTRKEHLLLVAATKLTNELLRATAADVETVNELRGDVRFLAAPDDAETRERAEDQHGEVLANGKTKNETVSLPLRRHVGQPDLIRFTRVAKHAK